MRILEFVVKESTGTEQTKRQVEEEIFQKPQWSKVSYEVGKIVRKVLDASLPPNEADALTGAFMNVTNTIAIFEAQFATAAADFMNESLTLPRRTVPLIRLRPGRQDRKACEGLTVRLRAVWGLSRVANA